jgi:hypothetical protein
MKKLLRNKTMFLTLIAGMLVFVAVLGAGTFAWFTGRAEITVEGEITMATVGVEADNLVIKVLDFYPATAQSLDFQQKFEASFGNHADFVDVMWAFKSWQSFPAPLYTVYPNDQVVFPPASQVNVYMIENSFTKKTVLPDIVNVTPGCIIQSGFDFFVVDKNDKELSSIPVYFAIKKADLKVAGVNLKYDQLITLEIIGDNPGTGKTVNVVAELRDPSVATPATAYTVELKEPTPADGWLYCNLPLSPEYAWRVEVKQIAYVFGKENGNDLQGANIIFSDGKIEVEVIQATNNAVYLADGWKNVAGTFGNNGPDNPFFIEYVVDSSPTFASGHYGMYDVYKSIL